MKAIRLFQALRQLSWVGPLVIGVGACDPSAEGLDTGARATAPPGPLPTAPIADTEQPADQDASDAQRDAAHHEAAKQRIQAVLRSASLPMPAFEAVRAQLLARAEAEPIFFVRDPEYPPDSSDAIRHYRYRLRTTRHPLTVLEQLLPHFAARPEDGRASLLREGYLYAENPLLAHALVHLVGPEHLFDEPHIWVQRGERLMHGERQSTGEYRYADGPYRGQRVRLLHLDRIGAGQGPDGPPLHRDFRSLRERLGFQRARIRHISQEQLVADLRYGEGLWVPTLLRARGPRLELAAEAPPRDEIQRLHALRQAALDRQAGVRALRAAILAQVEERLPFDEPRTEVGQEDGTLRRSWQWVYSQGRDSYHVRWDPYRVFDNRGRPLVPQVCVDFILDSFERASGTWFKPLGESPGRTRGQLDFSELMPRDELRRVKRFLQFAETRPDWFEVAQLPPEEQLWMGHKNRFFRWLAERADDYRPADVVFIRGKTPWDDREEHSHSFFVYETDPLSGVPIAIVGNASQPEVRSWEAEARRTPRRSIRQRVRPTDELLRKLGSLPDAGTERLPAPLVPGHAHEAYQPGDAS